MNQVKTYIFPYMKRYKKLLTSSLLIGFLAIFSAAMLTFTSGYLISRASQRPETILLVYVPIVAVRTFGISRAALRYVERLLSHDAVLRILSDMRVALYRALEPQALFIRSRFQTGDLLGTLSDDIEHLLDVYIRTVFPVLIGLFLFAFAIVSIAVINPFFAMFMFFAAGIIVFVYPMWSLFMMKKKTVETKRLHSALYTSLTEMIFGIRDWMISGRTKEVTAEFMAGSRADVQAERGLAHFDQNRTLQLQTIAGCLVIAAGIWSYYEAAAGTIYPVYIAAVTLAALPVLEALLPMSHAVERLPAYAESFSRIGAIEKGAEEFTDKPAYSGELPASADIYVNGVSYRYENNGRKAVDDVTLSIPQGRKIAILGRSGAGKSTLLQLITGALQPEEGSVTAGGTETAAFGDRIYDLIGVLNQKPYVFATTVENNIRLGNAHSSEADVRAAVESVKLNAYIDSLPDGLKTQTEETGQRFSGGERQRIALARILLKNTPVVVLDEPTIGLDAITENELLTTIFESLSGKTIIWITHHLAGMDKMDQIIFMDEGRVSMSGTHDELMQNERYRRLYELDHGLR